MARFRGDLAWRHFVGWCKARRLRPLPAHPWTLAAYARACERRFPQSAIAGRVRAIAKAHVLQGHSPPDRHPTVTRTLRMIETRQRRQQQGSDLFEADLADTPPPPPPQDGPAPADAVESSPLRRSLRSTPRVVSRRPGRGGD